MANGDVRKILNTNRIVVEADNLGYVLEVPAGHDAMEVVADFMAAWRVKAKNDRKLVAIYKKRNQLKEAKAKGVSLKLIEGMSDEEIDKFVAAERKPLKFGFEGFDAIEPEAAKAQAPVVTSNPESAPVTQG